MKLQKIYESKIIVAFSFEGLRGLSHLRNYARLRNFRVTLPPRQIQTSCERNEFLLAIEKQKRRRGEKRARDGSPRYKYIKSGNHPKWAPRYRIRSELSPFSSCRLSPVVCRATRERGNSRALRSWKRKRKSVERRKSVWQVQFPSRARHARSVLLLLSLVSPSTSVLLARRYVNVYRVVLWASERDINSFEIL